MLAEEIRQAVQNSLEKVCQDNAYRTYMGPNRDALMSALQSLIGVEHCMLTSSGTAALEIGLRAGGIQAGDHVLLSGYDYPGNFWAVERIGAIPVLVDCEPDSWRISESAYRRAFEQFPQCRALIASHLHGTWQDAQELRQWCDEVGILFFEDACQSVGSKLTAIGPEARETSLGSFGHFSLVSFGGSKVLSAGRGGALLTNDASFFQRAKIFSGAGSGPYDLSELQATVVLAQLPFLERLNGTCWTYFQQLGARLTELGDSLPAQLRMPAFATTRSVEQKHAIASNGIYQFGLLVHARNAHQVGEDGRSLEDSGRNFRDLILAHLEQHSGAQSVAVGHGFSGFHRRSRHRCRIPGKLNHTRLLAESTLTLHHRIALDGGTSVETLATQIAAAAEAAARNHA